MYIDLVVINKWNFPLFPNTNVEKRSWRLSESLPRSPLCRFAVVKSEHGGVSCDTGLNSSSRSSCRLFSANRKTRKSHGPTLPAGPARSHRHSRLFLFFFCFLLLFFFLLFFSNFVAAFSVWTPKCCQTRHVNIYRGHFSKARLTEDSKGEGRSRCASPRRSSRPDDGAGRCSPAAVPRGLRRTEGPFAARVTGSFLS